MPTQAASHNRGTGGSMSKELEERAREWCKRNGWHDSAGGIAENDVQSLAGLLISVQAEAQLIDHNHGFYITGFPRHSSKGNRDRMAILDQVAHPAPKERK